VSVPLATFCCSKTDAPTDVGPLRIGSPGRVRRLVAILTALGSGGKDECDLCNVWDLRFRYHHGPTEWVQVASHMVSRLKPAGTPYPNLLRGASQALFRYLYSVLKAHHVCRKDGYRVS